MIRHMINNSPNSTSRQSVFWITNTASPYRRPVWAAMAQNVDLTVGILSRLRHLKKSGRRPLDWAAPVQQPGTYRMVELDTVELSGGENPRYAFLSTRGMPDPLPEHVVIGGWDQPAYWTMLCVAKRKGSRIVGFYESTLLTNRYSSGAIAAARRFFFKQLDAVVTPGSAASEAVARMGVPSDRIFQGFNAVDVAHFHRVASLARQAQAHGPKHDFVYVGQLIPRKNVETLLHALLQIPGASLLIVGTGILEGHLRTQADRLGISSRVTFAGAIANESLPRVLAQCRTLVLPSLEEVWGLVVNEALASGLRVIVSHLAGVSTSVASMAGVSIVAPTADDLAASMEVTLREVYIPNERPEILKHGPEAFAQVFERALGLA